MNLEDKKIQAEHTEELKKIAHSVMSLQSVFSGLNSNYKFAVDNINRVERKMLKRDKTFYDLSSLTMARIVKLEKEFIKANDLIVKELIEIKAKIVNGGGNGKE